MSAPPQIPTQQQSLESEGWKQQLAERLEAYRAKMTEHDPVPSENSTVSFSHTRHSRPDSRSSSIARAVASRYAASPSYSAILLAAAESERAAHEAHEQQEALQRLAAEAAAQKAMLAQEQAAAASKDLSHESSLSARDASLPLFSSDGKPYSEDRYGSAMRTQPGTAVMPQFAERSREMRLHQTPGEPEPSLEDLLASSVVEPRSLLPSKLIEFPRELVSTHRARPRLPDGAEPDPHPAVTEQEAAQLRIFEVQPESKSKPPAEDRQPSDRLEAGASGPRSSAPAASTQAESSPLSRRAGRPANSIPGSTASSQHRTGPAISAQGRAPQRATLKQPVASAVREPGTSPVRAFKGLEWAAISLDKDTVSYRRKHETTLPDSMPLLVEPASINRRVMAFAVDFAAVTSAFLGFLVVFVASTPHLPTGLTAVMLSGTVYASLWLLYQVLFFSLSGATAGMLYARIALCTFDDQNPSRSALRRRLAAWWLSCLPLGLGFLWSFLDEDNLCWHDRMTSMYQRTY